MSEIRFITHSADAKHILPLEGLSYKPKIIPAPGGGELAFEETGDPNGFPVILHHGMPGSAIGIKPRQLVLIRHGIRLISHDRPGYGYSSRQPGRRIVDDVQNVVAIREHLGIADRPFGMLARSGGSPHALACAAAAEFAGHLVGVALLSPTVPQAFNENGEWPEDLADSNKRVYEGDVDTVIEDISKRAARVQINPDSLLDELEPELKDPDRRVLAHFAMRRLITYSYTQAVRQGPGGWIDDVLALNKPPGYNLSDIRCRVFLWHGALDPFALASQTRQLDRQITHAPTEVTIAPNESHFTMLEEVTTYMQKLGEVALSQRSPA